MTFSWTQRNEHGAVGTRLPCAVSLPLVELSDGKVRRAPSKLVKRKPFVTKPHRLLKRGSWNPWSLLPRLIGNWNHVHSRGRRESRQPAASALLPVPSASKPHAQREAEGRANSPPADCSGSLRRFIYGLSFAHLLA